MLELEFTAEDMARTRFAISPLWEVVAGLRVLLGADEQGLHRRWAEPVRARIAAAKLDLTPLAALVPPPSPSVPGFICPPPTTPWPSLEVELTALRRTPASSCVRSRPTPGPASTRSSRTRTADSASSRT